MPEYSLAGFIEKLNSSFYFNGVGYGIGPGLSYTLPGTKQEQVAADFRGLSGGVFKSNSVAFACMAVRMRLFRQARFKFRDDDHGHLFTAPGLDRLRTPWAGGTTADLLARMIQYADLGGNAFVSRNGDGVTLLRPDWVTIIGGTNGDPNSTVWDVDAEVLAYVYQPGGPGSDSDPVVFLADEIAHFMPIPDPDARFRGMSWLTPAIREVMADKAMTDHRLAFFENGATPNLVISLPAPDLKTFQEYVQMFKGEHDGAGNAYKTIFLAQGADATVVGKDLQQLEFKITQGGGETRLAAAAGVPPVIVGLSEGLQAATYSNYASARRHFSDTTLRDLWQDACGSLARITDVPSRSELWYDERAIAFLQEDLKDAAEIMQVRAIATKTFVDAGYKPESVQLAVAQDDMSLLEHSGLVSVQLQPPGTTAPDTPAPDQPAT